MTHTNSTPANPTPPGWPDPLESPQAEAIRNGKLDDTEIRNLFDCMERELRLHRERAANPVLGVSGLLLKAVEMAERSAALNEVYQAREEYLRFAQDCRAAIGAALTAAIGTGGQVADPLPCDVQLPGILLKRGVSFETLMVALRRRFSWPEADTRLTHPAPSGKAVEPRKTFPILSSGGQKIDWQLVADHGEQARKNHYQTVEKLAQRGGLSWCELHAVLHNRSYQKMDTNEAIVACRELEARYLSALALPAPSGQAVARENVAYFTNDKWGGYWQTVRDGKPYNFRLGPHPAPSGQAVAGESFCKGDDSYQDDERDFKTFRITRCLNGKGEHYDQIDVHGDEKLRDRIIDLLNGTTLSNPPAQPGWRMVPEEPTEEMRDDAWNALNSRGLRHFGMSDILAIWKAMLTAAPLPGGA